MMMNNMSQGLGSFNNMMPQNNMMQQNPYGQQMNPQMMGQQMQSPEMFSEQLMNPMMSQIQDPMQGLQPMAEPEGFGVYGQSLEGYAEGGEAVPRETEIMGQPHMLAYINPEEEMMLRQMGGSGMAGPGGVPSYPPTGQSGPGANVGPSNSGNSGNSNNNNNDKDERRAAAARLAQLQARAAAAEKMVADQEAEKIKANQAANQLAAETLAAQQSTTSTAGDTALKTSLVPESRIADLTDNSETSGIMSVVNDVKQGIKNFIEDVGMTYAGGIGSFSDLTNSDNYAAQYKKIVDAGYSELDASDYLNNTRAGQIAIRDKNLDIKKTISDEERAIMKDERLAEEARIASAASTAVGTGIDTIPISTGLPSGAGTTGVVYEEGPVEQQMAGPSYIPVGDPNAVVPTQNEVMSTQPVAETINTQVPAATVDPMTPVGGNFLLPGQQNYGPTPAAALNFNPNTYMQTPQNANVALSAMFQDSNPYTFEELLSMYKPAYPSVG